MTMLEKVARALYNSPCIKASLSMQPEWESLHEDTQAMYLGLARDALRVLEKLPHGLIKQGSRYVGYHSETEGGKWQDANHCWQRILDGIIEQDDADENS